MRAVALAVLLALAAPAAADSHGVALPRGSRQLAGDRYSSGKGPTDTYAHVARALAKAKIAHRAVPLTRTRGVLVGRFLSDDPATTWAAIHVYRLDGPTLIYFVARPAPAAP